MLSDKKLAITFAVFSVCLVSMVHSRLISKTEWNALQEKGRTRLSSTPTYVMIHHSDTGACTTEAACTSLVQGIQRDHMTRRGWKDIGYNFLIGGDGNIYEGRGWGLQGSHCPGYNSRSIGICVIGNFTVNKPPTVQLDALKELIQLGVANSKIQSAYRLVGHRQGRETECPGDGLFNEIKTWPNFYST